MADQIIDLAEMRKKLRPPPPPPPDTFVNSLMHTLANIDAIYAARKALTDG